ncbi:Decaprenyl diphosphate synthase-like protein [Pelagophyceae sp. CCMP2097]|nr:Decaprenyl diphosphate synthase-like protein [Pelagophyceae sp. CCMP2097]
MDGNRRYGERKFGDVGSARKLEGHSEGGRKLGDVIEWCMESGVRELTCFAFSTENWNREQNEVDMLMRTFISRCEEIGRTARERGVRVVVLSSDTSRIPAHVSEALDKLVRETALHSTMTLNLAVSYGARGELANAARGLAVRVRAGTLDPEQIDEASFESELLLSSAPDLLLRTSGEFRLSNFLLWQLAYTELVFVDQFWPELTRLDFDGVLDEFARRKRRYGK